MTTDLKGSSLQVLGDAVCSQIYAQAVATRVPAVDKKKSLVISHIPIL